MKQTDELIGKINGKFGTIDWTPILYQYRHLPLHPLAALYSLSDVALVTPLRDGMNLVAEHGAWLREKSSHQWRMLKPLAGEWKRQIAPIFDRYTDLLPGSFLEEKEFSVVWHYRKADPERASQRAKELRDNLVQFTANIDVQVLQGSMVIEVRNSGVNKGAACRQRRFLSSCRMFLGCDVSSTKGDKRECYEGKQIDCRHIVVHRRPADHVHLGHGGLDPA